MTDQEYAAMAAKLGLAGEGLKSPSQIEAEGAKSLADITKNPPTIPSLLSPQYAISNAPADTSAGTARATINRFATDQPGSQRLTSEALKAVIAPATLMESSPVLSKAIDESLKFHQEEFANQQRSLSKAVAMLGDLDATDTQKNDATAIIQHTPTGEFNPGVAKQPGSSLSGDQSYLLNLNRIKYEHPELSDDAAHKLQQDAFVANLTPYDPALATAKQDANLNVGKSWRMLQDLGIQFPGSTANYATAPIFKPDAPPPPQKIERAQPVPGQTVDASGKVVQAPASSIGLTTVRGTEFGQIDNPQRGGYTEANWNVGAWGGDIADTKTPFVALPVSVLNKYGNSGDAKFESDFNSKFDVQVIDPATGKVVVASVRDKGPGARTGAGLDMGWATREQLGLPVGFSGNVSYRIVPKGSALPDGSTPSVQQQNATASQTGDFAAGATPHEVYIKPIDPSRLRDPSIHGPSMSTGELAQWARHQTDEYAGALDDAGHPMTVQQYQEQFQKFFEGGQKYQAATEKPTAVPQEWNTQFNALAALVSPTGTPDGSQLDLLKKYFDAAKKSSGTGMSEFPGFPNPDVQMFKSQRQHLLTPIAVGVMGMTPGDAGNENVTKELQKVLPGEWDSLDDDKGKPGTASQKLANIKASVQDQMRRLIQTAKAEHHDTTALEQTYRQIFVNSKQQVSEADIGRTQNKVTAFQPNKPAAPQMTPDQKAQQRAAVESQALKTPPPTF